jgi:hypothetical protein
VHIANKAAEGFVITAAKVPGSEAVFAAMLFYNNICS